ncbi:hypothetical protein GH714_027245 [Hevea brasiliensis]|uniref:Peptidase S26 domain-containing protein n=1 Tax=Hevea brasiliensis TaxID=3981 RepID=A0A6A6KXD9_HEVBR|nr:hypothetical protein GH714_027245 [Hevea brasiliensis]
MSEIVVGSGVGSSSKYLGLGGNLDMEPSNWGCFCWRCSGFEGSKNSESYLVRRLAASEGHEMVSNDGKDEPFVLEKDQCWVLADNEKLKPTEANDSRIFGPVPMSDIVGRVIYCLRTPVDHGPVQNSHFSMRVDSPVLEVELDVEEMAKNHKA